jgi:hypothetical protein
VQCELTKTQTVIMKWKSGLLWHIFQAKESIIFKYYIITFKNIYYVRSERQNNLKNFKSMGAKTHKYSRVIWCEYIWIQIHMYVWWYSIVNM